MRASVLLLLLLAAAPTSAAAAAAEEHCFGLPGNSSSVSGSVLVLSGTTISCSAGLTVLFNSTLRCSMGPNASTAPASTVPSPPCTITILASSVHLDNASSIVAGYINITSTTLYIGEGARIDASVGNPYLPATAEGLEASGGSHAGYGKVCNGTEIQVTKNCDYISGWDMVDEPLDTGGPGFNSGSSSSLRGQGAAADDGYSDYDYGDSRNSSATDGGYGGGVVYLNVLQQISLFGNILANGGDSTGGGGGAGGSITVITDTICGRDGASPAGLPTNLAPYPTISANGGIGHGPHSGGGSGGRIAVHARNISTPEFEILASGGFSEGCRSYGAAGTQYKIINGISTLTISNSGHFTDAITPVGCIPKGGLWISTNLNNFVISAAAVVQCVSERMVGLSRFSVMENSRFSMVLADSTKGCSLSIDSYEGELSITSSSVKLTGADETSVCSRYLGIDTESSITIGPSSKVDEERGSGWRPRSSRSGSGSGSGGEFVFHLTVSIFEMTGGSSLTVNEGVLNLTGPLHTFLINDSATVVSAPRIVADNYALNVIIGQGAVMQTKVPPGFPTLFSNVLCPSSSPSVLNPLENTCVNSRQDDFFMIKFTSLCSLNVSGVIKTGYLIIEKVDSLVIDDGGSISATALGCPPNTGVGRGQQSFSGAGGGGGYGGAGGNGSSNGTIATGGMPYGNETLDGCLVGSGGGWSASEQSGSGGGTIIVLVSRNGDLVLNGTIDADGESLNSGFNPLAGDFEGGGDDPLSPMVPGGGAGSGGTIILNLARLVGSGAISANGGRGGAVGGGGGGGGRIVFIWATSEYDNAFDGSVLVTGGAGSDNGTAGGNGTAIALNCQAGRAGVFCEPCPPGTYGDSEEAESCKPCINPIPRNAFYSDQGVSSPKCPYQCLHGYHGRACAKIHPSSSAKWPSLSALFQSPTPLAVICVVLFIVVASAMLVAASTNLKRSQKYTHVSPPKHKPFSSSAQQSTSAYFLDSLEEVMRNDKMKTAQDQFLFRFRIILDGDNSFHRPWKLSTQLPDELQDVAIEEPYVEFATTCNSLTKFLWWEGSVYCLLSVLLPPASRLWLQWRRVIRVRKLESFISVDYRHAFLRSCRARALRDGITFHSSPGHSFACIEILLRDDDMRGKYNTASASTLDISELHSTDFPKDGRILSEERPPRVGGVAKALDQAGKDAFLLSRPTSAMPRDSARRPSAATVQEIGPSAGGLASLDNYLSLTLLSPFTFFFIGDGDLLHPYSLENNEDRSSLLGSQISHPGLRRIMAGMNLRVLQGLLIRPFGCSNAAGLAEVQDFVDAIVKRALLKRGYLCELFFFAEDGDKDSARPAWVVLSEESPLLSNDNDDDAVVGGDDDDDDAENPPGSAAWTNRGSFGSVSGREDAAAAVAKSRQLSLSMNPNDMSDDDEHSSAVPLLKDRAAYMDATGFESKLGSPDSSGGGAPISPRWPLFPSKRTSDWVEKLEWNTSRSSGGGGGGGSIHSFSDYINSSSKKNSASKSGTQGTRGAGPRLAAAADSSTSLPPNLIMRAIKHRIFMSKASSLYSIESQRRRASSKSSRWCCGKSVLKSLRLLVMCIPRSASVIPYCIFSRWRRKRGRSRRRQQQQEEDQCDQSRYRYRHGGGEAEDGGYDDNDDDDDNDDYDHRRHHDHHHHHLHYHHHRADLMQQHQLLYAVGFCLLVLVLADLFLLVVSFANLAGQPLVLLILPNLFPVFALLLAPISVLAALLSREEAAGRLSLWASSVVSWSFLPVAILLTISLSLNRCWSWSSYPCDSDARSLGQQSSISSPMSLSSSSLLPASNYAEHILGPAWIFVPALLFLCKWLQLGFLSSFVVLNIASDLALLSDDAEVFWA